MPHVNDHPIKDENKAHPIAGAWRPTIRAIAGALAEGDWALSRGIPDVAPLSADDADRIRRYVAAYGETLTELSEETWDSSVSQWMETHWEVIVDLWTIESGRSDLVLSMSVFETGDGFRYEIHSVHVP